jgi:hypothetical protein
MPITSQRRLTSLLRRSSELVDQIWRRCSTVQLLEVLWSLLDYNADSRDDPFRPYGTPVGHWLEWSRLLLHLEASLVDPPAWVFEDACTLFDSAVRAGWAVDGAEGFVLHARLERPAGRARPYALGHSRSHRRCCRLSSGAPGSPSTSSGIGGGGTTPRLISSIGSSAAGITNWVPTTSRRSWSGRASPTSTTHSRPYSSRSCR